MKKLSVNPDSEKRKNQRPPDPQTIAVEHKYAYNICIYRFLSINNNPFTIYGERETNLIRSFFS